jgi:hypothetical protein
MQEGFFLMWFREKEKSFRRSCTRGCKGAPQFPKSRRRKAKKEMIEFLHQLIAQLRKLIICGPGRNLE